MYIPFLVCCSLHLRWVRYVMMPVNVADRGVWNERNEQFVSGHPARFLWLVCDMNAPWLNRQGGGYEIGICGVPCCYAWHWVSSYRGRRDASMSLSVFLSKLTVVLVGLKVWSCSSTLSLGVLDHCCWRQWPNKWTTTVPGLPCLPGQRLLTQRRCGR